MSEDEIPLRRPKYPTFPCVCLAANSSGTHLRCCQLLTTEILFKEACDESAEDTRSSSDDELLYIILRFCVSLWLPNGTVTLFDRKRASQLDCFEGIITSEKSQIEYQQYE
jgi:hypothetical protein